MAIALLCAPPMARADLYRWVDPQTGSVKYSNYPPAEGRASEVLPYQAPKPAPKDGQGASAADSQEALEARRRALLQSMLDAPADPRDAGAALQRQAQAYQAVTAELDRIDPQGAARRRAEEAGLAETMRKRVQAEGKP
jgi:DNA-binding TFAR19-related protein (PDSD5 family)